MGIGKVEPHDVQIPELCEQLARLTVKIGCVFPDVPILLRLPEDDVIPHGVQTVDGEFRMVPVDQRMVEADPETRATKRLYERLEQIAPSRRVGCLGVGEGRIPQAEPLVVFGGDHRIFHARVLGLLRPGTWVIEIRVKVVKVFLVHLVGYALPVLDPLVTGRQGIQTPMDKETEAVVNKPVDIGYLWLRHGFTPFLVWAKGCRTKARSCLCCRNRRDPGENCPA